MISHGTTNYSLYFNASVKSRQGFYFDGMKSSSQSGGVYTFLAPTWRVTVKPTEIPGGVTFAVAVTNTGSTPATPPNFYLCELTGLPLDAGNAWATNTASPAGIVHTVSGGQCVLSIETPEAPLVITTRNTANPPNGNVRLAVWYAGKDSVIDYYRQAGNYPKLLVQPGASTSLTATVGVTDPAPIKARAEANWRNAYPATLVWPDRRPIGMSFPTSGNLVSASNPSGWIQPFSRDWILNHIRACISNTKSINGQGIIVQGLDGGGAHAYRGCPEMFEALCPELRGITDDLFGMIREAGLIPGVCVRPQQLDVTANGIAKVPSDYESTLIGKIQAARYRFGCRIFYIDVTNRYATASLRRLAALFPDCLLIPEHSTRGQYGCAAPYLDDSKGVLQVDRTLYPHAFGFHRGWKVTDKAALTAAVKAGDILGVNVWYSGEHLIVTKDIYAGAMK